MKGYLIKGFLKKSFLIKTFLINNDLDYCLEIKMHVVSC